MSKNKNKYTTQNLSDLSERRSKNMASKYGISGVSNLTFSSFGTGRNGTSPLTFTFNSEDFKMESKSEIKEEPKKIMKPKEIKAHLDQYIIGQEEAKIALSVAVYNHYRRINSKIDDDGIELQKSNILMVGKSGSGKTLLVQTIAKLLDVPFIIVDATAFTPTGIVGKDIEDIIKDLLSAANGDKKKAEKGIVFIDEIDKIAGNTMTRTSHNVKGVLGGATQSSLLKLIEGNEVQTHDRGGMFSNTEKLNTKNVLFICGGAFDGIEELVEKQKDECTKSIGFTLNNNKITSNESIDIWNEIGAEEIIKYGMMPEIVGRLPVIVKLKPLTKENLVHILTEPKNAIVKQYKKLLDIDGVYLDFTSDALETIAEMAIKMKTGARGLRGIVDNIVTKIIFNLPDDEYERRCIITGVCIKNNILPELIKTIDDTLLL